MVLSSVWAEAFWLTCQETSSGEGSPTGQMCHIGLDWEPAKTPFAASTGYCRGAHHPVTMVLRVLTLHKWAAVLYSEYKWVTSLLYLEDLPAIGNHSVNPFLPSCLNITFKCTLLSAHSEANPYAYKSHPSCQLDKRTEKCAVHCAKMEHISSAAKAVN